MNDPDPISSSPPKLVSSTSPESSAPTSIDPTADTSQTIDDGWFDRLKALLGLRGNGTLRDSIEDALNRDELSDRQFSPEERLLLRNILRLREVRIDDVMVPRADIDAVDEQVSLGNLLRGFQDSGHSRMPVYRETLDDPRGMVHIKDLMAFLTNPIDSGSEAGDNDETASQSPVDLGGIDLSTPLASTDLLRAVLFVPPSMPAPDLMAKMQATRMQMALVIDEYGGTDGLVSLEDLVEEVVGEIEDEHDDDDEPEIEAVGDGMWIADARVDLDNAVETVGAGFNLGEIAEEVDTLGGLVFTIIGRIPVRGELISSPQLPGFEFEVLDADPRRIKRLRVCRRRDGRPAEARRRGRRIDAAGANDA